MRIVPANTKPVLQDDVLPHTRLPPCEVGRVHKHMYLSFYKANTDLNKCLFQPYYLPGSHQLAGRLVCLAHGFLVCPIRGSYM